MGILGEAGRDGPVGGAGGKGECFHEPPGGRGEYFEGPSSDGPTDCSKPGAKNRPLRLQELPRRRRGGGDLFDPLLQALSESAGDPFRSSADPSDHTKKYREGKAGRSD